jgi:PKD repeat protein
MNLEDLHIACSPLTDTISMGTVSKTRPGTWLRKVDCTSKFIGALMHWTPPGTVRTIRDNHGNQYEIEVRAIGKDRKEGA